MKISIVIVSYNQVQYLEHTIRSVIDQNYLDKEIILIDGGSTDGSLEIIKKYKQHFHYWISEKDHGQADAIAKGFAICTGKIITWINSDDLLMPGVLENVSKKAVQVGNNDGVFYGGAQVIDKYGETQERSKYGKFNYYIAKKLGPTICQPGTFYGKDVYDFIGGINPKLHYSMDYDLFCNFLFSGVPFYYTGTYHAKFRRYSEQKGHSIEYGKINFKETSQIRNKYGLDKTSLLERILSRAAQIVFRIINGYYFNTLSFRILMRNRFREHRPELSN